MEDESRKKYICKRRGCNEEFSHKTQLYRHKKDKCSGTSPKKIRNNYKKQENGHWKCCKCEKVFSDQANTTRHVKNCGTKEKEIIQCTFCNKVFQYKSVLKRHEKTHENDIPVASFVTSSFIESDFENLTINSSILESSDVDVTDAANISSGLTEAYAENSIVSEVFVPESPNVLDSNLLESSDADVQDVANDSVLSERDVDDLLVSNLFDSSVPESLPESSGLNDASDNDSEKLILNSLLEHLKKLYGKPKRTEFMEFMTTIFGVDNLSNTSLIYFLTKKMGIDYRNLKRGVQRWISSDLKEIRGNKSLPLTIKQKIYDMWIKNSIPSTDSRNDRSSVKISKLEYLRNFSEIENKDVEIIEIENKRGRINFVSNRRIFTGTIRGLQKKLADENVVTSIGSIIKFKPFFITYASNKELSLCLCKLCLNVKFMFDVLMKQAKKDNEEISESVSSFFMVNCHCPKSVNGFFQWSCVTKKCKNCKKSDPATLKCQTSDEIVTVNQFEAILKEYLKFNKKTKEIETKTTKLTDLVPTSMSLQALFKKFLTMKTAYVTHKYHVHNDRHHWPIILSTVPEYGVVHHSDYSENMSQLHKREVQSAHFNKASYSLHCTVEHIAHETSPFKSPYRYIYHLSNDMVHDFAFTSVVAMHCINMNEEIPPIIRRKSDNCAVQYKSKHVFGEYLKLAETYNRKVIVYYGPAGHGKGLVDAMSSFGVKAPLLKAVLTEDFKYRSAKDIHEYLTQLFADDVQKVHCYLPSEEIMAKRQNGAKPIKIAGCMKLHMICFNPNGSICTKVNICSCPECLKGDFQECSIEKGKLIKANFVDEDSDSADSDVEYEDEFHEELDEDFEAYELRSENILQLVVPGDIAALFSPMNSLELFYLCKILEVSVAEEDIHDKYHHCIPKGSSYFLVNYYEKKPNSEFNKNGFVIYKKIKYTAYVLPNHVMLPKVNVTNIGLDIHVAMGEYQWICDCIGTF